MALRLTNTLTGRKEEFQPLNPPKVTLYVCGVTVYDHCHVGHARGAVIFDTLLRYLTASGFSVTYVRNVTDIDDKIIDQARLEAKGKDLKQAVKEVAKRYEASFRDDFSRLGLISPTHEPHATEFIRQMILFIELLLQRGFAYEGSDGVYFPVRKFTSQFPSYGQLSHQKLDQMLEGTRLPAGEAGVEPGEGKQDPLDFALWKKAKPEEPNWPSPWGEGRPGWHIECSTMSTALLGDSFDIHGGGQDLIFPHHENEMAQAKGAGKPFARFWLHNGLLTVNGQKMSKSLGNIVTIPDVLKRHPPEVLRLFFLSAHYRSPQDFTWERLDEAAKAYDDWDAFLRHADALGVTQPGDLDMAKTQEKFPETIEKCTRDFFEGMNDDLNTSKAIAALHLLVSFGNQYLMAAKVKEKDKRYACIRLIRDKVQELGRLLGFFQVPITAVSLEADELAKERDKFRQLGHYAAADEIRQRLIQMGYIVEDTEEGTIVRKRV